jgi:tetratricopeptide (TPR) repeat protein
MATASDPFEPYLNRAASLFDLGDVVQAGQIWQAILKRDPNHAVARAGLYKVKVHFDARATQDGLIAPAPPPVPEPKLSPAAAEPNEVGELLERGCALYDAGRTEEAVAAWEKVLSLDAANTLARGYLDGAKRRLEIESVRTGSLPLLKDEPAPAPAQEHQDLEQLLQDGCTLFDMGQTGDALLKWERILAANPTHALALAYANDARKELGLAPLQAGEAPAVSRPASPLPARPADQAEADADASQVEQWVLDGVQLYDMGMLDEAIEKWQDALALDPSHGNAAAYLQMGLRDREQAQKDAKAPARAPSTSASILPPTAPPMPPPAPAPSAAPAAWVTEPQLPAARSVQVPVQVPAPVGPPKALTTPANPPRVGLKVPGAFKGLALPEWLTTPRNLGMLIGALVLLGVSSYFLWDHLRDVARKEAVASAKAEALRAVSRQVQVAALAETPEAVRKEAEAALGDDPLQAFFRGQEWLRLDQDNAAAAQFVDRARSRMTELPPSGTLADFQKFVQAGDLEAAAKVIRGLLRQTPDAQDYREKARGVDLALAQYYANKERFGDAKDALCRVRAMFPQEKIWQAKLRLLETIQAMPRADRAGWIQMLG